MPLYDFVCRDCGNTTEMLVTGSEKGLSCPACGSSSLSKLLSAPSSLSGAPKSRLPGPGDTACCGASPSAAGCAGPGSCCGHGR